MFSVLKFYFLGSKRIDTYFLFTDICNIECKNLITYNIGIYILSIWKNILGCFEMFV